MWRVWFLGLCVTSAFAEPGPMPRAVHLDPEGDILPEGAYARIGSTRFRAPGAQQLHIEPDGTHAIVVDDWNVSRWDLQTGKRTNTWPLPDDFHGVVTPDGRWAVHLTETTRATPGGLELWDIRGQRVVRTHHERGIGRFALTAITPDGRAIATLDGSPREYRLRLWDTMTGTSRVIGAVEHDVTALYFADAGKVLLANPRIASDSVVAFDLVHERELYQLEASRILSLGSTTQNLLLLHQRERSVYHAATGKALALRTSTMRRTMTPLLFEDATSLLVYHDPTTKQLVAENLKDAKIVARLAGRFTAAAPAPNTGNLWLLDADRGLLEWELKGQGRILKQAHRAEGLLGEPTSFGWSRVTNVFTVRRGEEEQLFDLRSQRPYSGFVPVNHKMRWGCCTEPPIHPKQIAADAPPINSDRVRGDSRRTLSPNGQLALAWEMTSHKLPVPYVREVHLAERCTGKIIHVLPVPVLSDAAFSSDSRWLATLEPNQFRVWDCVTGKEVFQRRVDSLGRLPVGASFGNGIAFAPDNRSVAIGHRDATVLLWHVTLPEQKLRPLTKADIENAWRDLASDDVHRAWQAVARFRDDSERSIPFLHDQLQPVRALAPEVTGPLLQALTSANFRTREQAMQQAYAHGDAAAPWVRSLLDTATDADLVKRLQTLEMNLRPTTPAPPQEARRLRALAVLLAFPDHPETRRLLTRLAEGIASARLTRAAKEAIEHLPKP